MRMITTLLIGLTISTLSAAEEPEKFDLTTRDGKVYTAAKITKAEADALTVFHAGGVARIPFENLSDELQKKYNYNSKTAKQKRTARQQILLQRQQAAMEEAAKKKARDQLIESKEDITFEVWKVMETGVIAWNLKHTKDHIIRTAKGRQAVIIDVDAYELYEGQTVRLDAAPYGTVDVNGSTLKCWINIPSD